MQINCGTLIQWNNTQEGKRTNQWFMEKHAWIWNLLLNEMPDTEYDPMHMKFKRRPNEFKVLQESPSFLYAPDGEIWGRGCPSILWGRREGWPHRAIRIPCHGAFSQISSSDNGALEHQCSWSLFSSPIKGCGFFWRPQPWSLQPTKFNVVALSNNVSDNKRIIHTASHG